MGPAPRAVWVDVAAAPWTPATVDSPRANASRAVQTRDLKTVAGVPRYAGVAFEEVDPFGNIFDVRAVPSPRQRVDRWLPFRSRVRPRSRAAAVCPAPQDPRGRPLQQFELQFPCAAHEFVEILAIQGR
jgi:hypothetical protein